MSDDVGIPSLGHLEDLADRLLEYAARELDPERTTLEVTGYADGDYRIRAYETVSIEPDPDRGTITERVEIRYNRQTEWIQRRRYEQSTDDGLLSEEVRDLEAYADPVALAAADEE